MRSHEFGPFRVLVDERRLLAGSADLPVGPRVVETLIALLERPGELCTRQELLQRIWPEGFVDAASLAQNIYILRKTFALHWRAPVIETVRRTGYRFVAPVSVVVSAN